MSVLKYIDPVTLEVKKVGAPKYDVYSKTESNTLFSTKQRIVSITLTTDWVGDASPYTQVISIDGITANSKVDLQPDAVVIQQMIDDGVVAMNIVNDNGVLTANAVGEKPTAEMIVQGTVTEVSV